VRGVDGVVAVAGGVVEVGDDGDVVVAFGDAGIEPEYVGADGGDGRGKGGQAVEDGLALFLCRLIDKLEEDDVAEHS